MVGRKVGLCWGETVFADVLVEFNEINSLIDNPYAGEAYSKFVLNILSEALDSDRRSLERELIKDATMGNAALVVRNKI